MRVLFALSLALAVTATASAQELLLKGGLNTAFFVGDDADGLDPRLGVVAGAGVRLPLTPQLGLQVEGLYSQEGAVDDGVGTYELDYLDIPVLLRAELPAGALNRLGVYAGPQVGIPLRAEFNPEIGPNEEESAVTDFALALGADFGSGPVAVDVRYVLGLNDALSDEVAGVPVTPLALRNQSVSFTLVYTLGGGRRY